MRRGTNSTRMKENNRRLILNLIRRGGFSRVDIAKITGLTKATVTILADEMMQDGLIAEESQHESTGVGRRPVYLRLCENSRFAVGFSLTRTEYQVGLFNLAGEAVEFEICQYSGGTADKTLENMAETVNRYKSKIPEGSMIGVGFASPGPIDYKSGIVLNPPNFEKWHNCKVAEKLFEMCGVPVCLENVSNALAIGEQYFGSCLNEDNYAYIVIDEGIGSGIVVNGQVYRGESGFGNELGHSSVRFDGLPCICGNRGCLECYASIPAILKNTGYKTWREAVESGDNGLIEREAEYLTCALVTLINLFDLTRIVLGGDISYRGEIIAEILREKIEARTIVRHPVRVSAANDTQCKAVAAAAVALQNLFFNL
ncbi:MAG: ROK family transcriptional regulator [Firmicutes bacterium]|nr:ROK family transcriptional regulator [Bacillota bacterium]